MKSSRRALLATIGATALAGCSTVRDVTGPDFERVPEPEPGADSWLAPGWGPRNRYSNPEASIPESEPSLEWRASIGPAPVNEPSQPVVADGTIVVGTKDRVVAFNRDSGKEHWSTALSDRDTIASPTIVDGTVYIGSDRGFYAIELATGRTRWRVVPETFSRDRLSTARAPIVADGRLFFSTGNVVGALDAKGNLLWQSEARVLTNNSGRGSGKGSLATADESVFVAGNSATVRYRADVDPWRGPLDSDRDVPKGTAREWVHSNSTEEGVRLGEKTVYQPMTGINYDDQGGVVAYDADTGEQLWSYKTAAWKAKGALSGESMYIGDRRGGIYAIDRSDGSERWTTQLEGNELRTLLPVAGRNGVVVTAEEQGIVHFSPEGSERWRLPIESWNACEVALTDGRIYAAVGTGDGDAYELRCYA